MTNRKIYLVMLLITGTIACSLQRDDGYYRARHRMVEEQIRSRGIDDMKVLQALDRVPRHLFVPVEYSQYAYDDTPLPIGYGQTISQPYIVAYMTSQLHLPGKTKVLEIGTGSGYQAAVLSLIADSVFTIEIVPELAVRASDLLKKSGYHNVLCRQGDGNAGWEEHSPYDAIMVTAAAEDIPPELIKQLKDGGRMIIPVGSLNGIQHLMIVTRTGDRETREILIPVRFVPFIRK